MRIQFAIEISTRWARRPRYSVTPIFGRTIGKRRALIIGPVVFSLEVH